MLEVYLAACRQTWVTGNRSERERPPRWGTRRRRPSDVRFSPVTRTSSSPHTHSRCQTPAASHVLPKCPGPLPGVWCPAITLLLPPSLMSGWYLVSLHLTSSSAKGDFGNKASLEGFVCAVRRWWSCTESHVTGTGQCSMNESDYWHIIVSRRKSKFRFLGQVYDNVHVVTSPPLVAQPLTPKHCFHASTPHPFPTEQPLNKNVPTLSPLAPA